MTENLIDVRTLLARSSNVRVEEGRDGVLHLLAGPLTLHLDRGMCQELTSTLTHAMEALERDRPVHRRPLLTVLRGCSEVPPPVLVPLTLEKKP